MESLFDYFKQVKDSLQIMIFLPGQPLITIDVFPFPSELDTISSVVHVVSLPNPGTSRALALPRQLFPILLVVLSVRGTVPNIYGQGPLPRAQEGGLQRVTVPSHRAAGPHGQAHPFSDISQSPPPLLTYFSLPSTHLTLGFKDLTPSCLSERVSSKEGRFLGLP